MTNLLIYNPKLIWSEHFDKNNNIKYDLTDYDSDHEINKDNDCEKDKIDILDSNFSIDNEKILIKIDEIINNTDFNKYNSIEILKMQDIIISYLNKYVVQNNILDKIFFVKLLSWLENSSNELANKIKLKRISHAFVNTKIPSIPRSSYKFCNFKDS